jgi:hypothetical protein
MAVTTSILVYAVFALCGCANAASFAQAVPMRIPFQQGQLSYIASGLPTSSR